MNIYLSYSAVDRDYAQQVYTHLRDEPDFEIWMDVHQLQLVNDWWTLSGNACRAADVVVGVASYHSIVLQRLTAEWSQAKKLYLVSLVNPRDYQAMMPERFAAHNVVFAVNENALNTLVEEIREVRQA